MSEPQDFIQESWMTCWYDQPPRPGLYYSETCDFQGNPMPGLTFWENGKPWKPASIPTKYFGPIEGALKPWSMTPLAEDEKMPS